MVNTAEIVHTIGTLVIHSRRSPITRGEWQAAINADWANRCCGQSRDEAIGALIVRHAVNTVPSENCPSPA